MKEINEKEFERLLTVTETEAICIESYMCLKEDEVDIEYAKVDALIFDKYFVSKLHLKKRYVGSESKDKMVCYNNTLKEVLKDKLEIVDRLSDNGNVVSASYVRKLISENKIDEALNYIPRENHTLIKTIVREKYGL